MSLPRSALEVPRCGRHCLCGFLDDLFLRRLSACFFEVADEGLFEVRSATGTDQTFGRIAHQHSPRVHQRDAVATFPSFMKWVEMKIVTRSLRESSIKSSQNPSRATGSTPDVGSSRINISG